MRATSAAVSRPEATAFSERSRAMIWERVRGASSVSSGGRLRSELRMLVGTKAGQSTETPTFPFASRRSWNSVSLRVTTACLLTL